MSRWAVQLFPAWAILASAGAWLWPGPLVEMKVGIVWLLGLVMLGMGLTLTPDDFRRVARRPRVVGCGALMQFSLMPLLAWLAARGLGLPLELTAGLVLVGCAPGGTASNVICYLARGDVALSISLTFTSTLLSVAATPMLTWLYVGQSVPVPVADMLLSIARVVIVPVALGVAIRSLGGDRIRRIEPVFPLMSVIAIVWIIAIVVALNAGELVRTGPRVLAAVIAHNLAGLACGYGAARLLRFSEPERRALAIEVGMQNSGLGVALAVQHFSSLAALPGALFSVWHNLSGSLLAALWGRRPGDGRV